MDRGVILLVAPADDVHALAVKRRVEALGGPRPVLCDLATFPLASEITWNSENGPFGARLRIAPALPQGISRRAAAEVFAARRPEAVIDVGFGEIVAVWLRRSRRVLVHPRLTSPELRRFAGETATGLIDGLLDVAPVYNSPAAEWRASHKFYQLVMAERSGLAIPRTLATSDPAAARKFVSALQAEGREAVYKQNMTGTPDGPPTRGFEEPDWQRIADVELCPTTFQERIRGGCDLRVAAIGGQLFAAEWRPAHGPTASVDVRLDGDGVCMWPAAVEPGLAEKVLSLHAAMGLTFAVYDLKVDADRGPVFLECNPTGQWLDLETEAGHPVSEAVARVLALRPPAAAGASAPRYSDSDLVEFLHEPSAIS